MRTAGIGARTAAVDDAIDPLTVVDFLRAQFEAKLLADHPGKEAAHRVLLPVGGTHDGSNRRPLRSAQHREHSILFRARPAIAERASFGLRLTRTMLLASGLLCRNGNPLAGGAGFGCSRFARVGGSRADARLLGSGCRFILDIDRFEAGLGDAKRHRSAVVIAAPDRERATGADLLQQAGTHELIDDLSGGFAFDVRRQFKPLEDAALQRFLEEDAKVATIVRRIKEILGITGQP